MGYTWGYLKDVILAKLDLTEQEANLQNLLTRFPLYANEAMTQICSAIKPKHNALEIMIYSKEVYNLYLHNFIEKYKLEFIKQYIPFNWDSDIEFTFADLTDVQLERWSQELLLLNKQFAADNGVVNKIIPRPSDFVSWSGDVLYYQQIDWDNNGNIIREHNMRELSDEDYRFVGDDGLMCFKPGRYILSYYARWVMFKKDMDNDVYLDIPYDILDCIPSYVAHQCFKIDDETKSAIFRNEYEIFLSRIDDTDFKQTKTLKIGGGW